MEGYASEGLRTNKRIYKRGEEKRLVKHRSSARGYVERKGRNSIGCDGSSVCDVEEMKGRDSQEEEREGEKQRVK